MSHPADDSRTDASSGSRISPNANRTTLLVAAKTLAALVGLGALIAFFTTAISSSRQAALRNRCTCHGKQLGVALWNYHDTYKSFPPAFIADSKGKPMHSWRVLILPFLEQRDIYDQYDFSERWDGPHNRRLASQMPDAFRCPTAKSDSNETSYVAVIAPETGWPAPQPRTAGSIKDGSSRTIALVEVANSGINWLEPRDLDLAQALKGINMPNERPSISSHHAGGAIVIWFDAHVSFLPNDLPTDVLRHLLTAEGGEQVVDPNQQ